MPRKTAAEHHAPQQQPVAESMDFENAINELETLIQAFENNRLPLEATLDAYQRGQQLIGRCSDLLKDAEQRLEQYSEHQPATNSDREPA